MGIFKYITKYYNRFFDIDKDCQRRDYLKELVPYILEYDTVIKAGIDLLSSKEIER